MKNYVAYLGSRATNDIVNYGLGDWYDLGPKRPGVAQLTPIALTATAFYFRDAEILARAAALLGKSGRREDNFPIWRKKSAPRSTRNFTTRPIAFTPPARNAPMPFRWSWACANRRTAPPCWTPSSRDVRAHGNALTAGDVGYRYLLRALADGGRSDVIFDMNNQSDKPGYGYQLKMGATSLTEAWDAGRDSSQNHFMLGQIQEWFYHDLAGIQNAPDSAGFKKIIIHPQPVGDVTWAKASYDSIRGKITVDWKRTDGNLTLKTTIPANTTATVFVPAKAESKVTESGVAAEHSAGVKFLRREGDRMVYSVSSGSYEFRSSF